MNGSPSEREPGFRYGAVLLFSLTLLIFLIAAPGGDWTRATVTALQGAA